MFNIFWGKCTRLSTYRPIRQGKGFIMLVKVEFEFHGKVYHFERITHTFEHDNDDEPFAYFYELSDKFLFQIFLRKDNPVFLNNFILIESGAYAVVFDGIDDYPLTRIDNVKVEFVK